MFIKVFVPNSRGKIELTVEELEELLSDACEKAVKEKCATCNRGWYGTGITYLNGNNDKDWDWTKVTCSNGSGNTINLSTQNTQSTLSSTVNELIGE
jgi:hypothetical protein